MDIIKKYILDVMNGNIEINNSVKNNFGKYYKMALNKGYYLEVNKEGKFILSNKHTDRNKAQLEKYDEFMKEAFILT